METINTINLVEEYGKLFEANERLQKTFTDMAFKAYAGLEKKDREIERLREENDTLKATVINLLVKEFEHVKVIKPKLKKTRSAFKPEVK